jgi:hypothetical protein
MQREDKTKRRYERELRRERGRTVGEMHKCLYTA